MKGKVVIITRDKVSGEAWLTYLKKHGVHAYHFPAITTRLVSVTDKLIEIICNITEFEWIIFTSVNGARYFFEFIKTNKITISKETLPRITTIGKKTADEVEKYGYTVSFIPSDANSSTLSKELPCTKGSQTVLFRTTIASDELTIELTKRGVHVIDEPIYQTDLVSTVDPKLISLLMTGKVDYITFASPSAVSGFLLQVPQTMYANVKAIPVIALGESVATVLKKEQFVTVLTSCSQNIEGVSQQFGLI